MFRRSIFALLALALLFVAHPPAMGADVPAQHAAEQSAQQPRTNAEIRQWYNDQVAAIPTLNQQWVKDGLSAEERARRAYAIRHGARVKARDFMPDKREVADLQARDTEKYGNPDGPTFDGLVAANRAKGLTGDAVYEDIVGSAKRTDRGYNDRFNVKPAQGP